MITRKTTEEEKEAFEYLNDLRESGITNMFGAGPFLQNYMGLERDRATELLFLWMEVFQADGDYEEITVKS